MFVNRDGYKTCLKDIVREEKRLDVAVAFWGSGAQKLIHPDPTIPIRIICNLRSGGTNPKLVKYFYNLSREKPRVVQIRQCDELHAKIVVGEGNALVGSANLSTNGFGLEDGESAYWIEAGVHTKDVDEVSAVARWFSDLWKSECVRIINDKDIDNAAAAWAKNRAGRPFSKSFSLDVLPVSELEDRPSYALFYKKELSVEATTVRNEAKKKSVSDAGASTKKVNWWGFENWPDFPKSHSGTIDFIGVHIGPRGAVRIDGVCRLLGGDRLSVSYDDPNEEDGWVDLARPITTLLGYKFKREEMKSMKDKIKGHIGPLWKAATEASGDDAAGWLHIADLARIIKNVEA